MPSDLLRLFESGRFWSERPSIPRDQRPGHRDYLTDGLLPSWQESEPRDSATQG